MYLSIHQQGTEQKAQEKHLLAAAQKERERERNDITAVMSGVKALLERYAGERGMPNITYEKPGCD